MSRAEAVVAAVARVFDIPVAEIRGPSRRHPVVLARHAAAYVLYRRFKQMGLPAIARLIGRSSASSVAYGIRRAEARMAQDEEYAALVRALVTGDA